MFSYETNIICDKCGKACVTGEPQVGFQSSVKAAICEALANGWRVDKKGRWFCTVCLPKNRGH